MKEECKKCVYKDVCTHDLPDEDFGRCYEGQIVWQGLNAFYGLEAKDETEQQCN